VRGENGADRREDSMKGTTRSMWEGIVVLFSARGERMGRLHLYHRKRRISAMP